MKLKAAMLKQRNVCTAEGNVRTSRSRDGTDMGTTSFIHKRRFSPLRMDIRVVNKQMPILLQ